MRPLFLSISFGLHLFAAFFGGLFFSRNVIGKGETVTPVFISLGNIQRAGSAPKGFDRKSEKSNEGIREKEDHSTLAGIASNKDEFVFRAGDIVRNGNTLPQYPQQALEQGIQGTVLLRLILSASGEVSQSEIVESSGSPILDLAAFAASKNWKFKVDFPVKKIIAPIKFVIES